MKTKTIDPKVLFSKDAVTAAQEGNRPSSAQKVEMSELAKKVAAQFSSDVISPMVIVNFCRLIELTLLIVSSLLIYLTYVAPIGASGASGATYVLVSFLGSALTILALSIIDGYQLQTMRNYIKQFSKSILAFAVTLMVMSAVAFVLKVGADFSRVWFVSWFAFGGAALLAFRAIMTLHIRNLTSSGRLERRAVIVGGGEPAADLIHSLESMKDNDIRVCGIFDDRSDLRSPPVIVGYPKLGTIDELVEFGRKARIDMLILTLPIKAENRVLALLKRLWVLPVDIRLSAQATKLRFRPRSYSYVGTVPFLDVFEKPIADWDEVVKRMFDISFSIMGLIAFSPIMLATAIAIRLESKGPVLFRQKRYGFNNEVIDVLKFRSMYHEMSDPDAKKVVTKGDPRVTKVGRFIRKSSIDELPQLVNVLKGQLSLVGPRPHAVNAHTDNRLWDEVVDGYFARHKVKPGVTGWAQINGWRGEVDNPEKIKQRTNFDLYYIENWSLLFDLKIVFTTPFKLLNSENAY
ncbi:MAG: undecaprenyl-phosphate glucose phosphotransferase [Nitratireductor sp.]